MRSYQKFRVLTWAEILGHSNFLETGPGPSFLFSLVLNTYGNFEISWYHYFIIIPFHLLLT